jgi:hypothetical protein
VAADSDRAFGDEPLFAGFLAADVMQDGITVGNQGVGNDLLVGRIGFGLGAGQEKIVPAREQGTQIFFRLEIQAMKTTELVEQTSPDNQNVFVGLAH